MSGPIGMIVIDPARCKGCGLCIPACPTEYIRLAEHEDLRGIRVACIDHDRVCTGCGFCYVVCPDVAISVNKLQIV